MKVHLLFNNPDFIRADYLNIDPQADGRDIRVRGSLADLNEHVDGGEVTELVAHSILGFFPMNAADAVLQNWLSKLAHDGIIVLSEVDIREVSRAILADKISLEDVNYLVHGQGYPRLSSYTVSQLVAVLESKGMEILNAHVNDFYFHITARRP